jgi:molybdopterin molybdotransferase
MALLPVADALTRVLDGVEPLPVETVAIGEAHRRVLARDLEALRTQPPEALSAMDGYAVRAADVAEAPVRLRLVGEVAAGRPFVGRVGPGEAARIFTGGVLPPGSDTVVIQELTSREGETLVVSKPTGAGRNVRSAGLDFKRGEVLLTKGTLLSGRDVALAAAMNHPSVPAHRRPKVAILATGDELVAPGSEPGPGQIVYSNVFSLAAIARDEGAEVFDLGTAPDRLDATVAAIRRARALAVDVLVTAGGASVGDYDLVQPALVAEGLALEFWRIALRPGKPLLFGHLGGMRVLGVPGNPVSAYVCALLFLVPLLRRLSGRVDLEPRLESAILGADLRANDEREDYLRASLSVASAGERVAIPFPVQDSSMMLPLAKADCLIIRAPYAPAAPAGTPCTIVKLDR